MEDDLKSFIQVFNYLKFSSYFSIKNSDELSMIKLLNALDVIEKYYKKNKSEK